jgi:signal transduction histidine kinase/PAS domain-containing protein
MMLPQERASLTAEIPKHPDQDNGLTGFSSYELTDLSSIVQSLPAVIYTYTVNSDTGECNFPFVSDYSEEMFGLPSSKIVENSEAFVNLVHPDDANEFAESVLHSMIHLTVWDHKMRMKDVNGEIVYVHAKSTPSLREIVNDDGSITKITIWNGVLFDVTNNSIEKEESDSKENNDNTEETISKKMTKTISKKMTMKRPIEDTWQSYLPCFEIDKDGTILSWNKVMTELTIGLLEQDVIGKNVRSIVPNTRQGKKEVERFLKANLNLLSVSDHSASSAEEEDLLESLDSSSSCEQIKQCEKHLEVYLHNLRVLTKTSTEIHLRVNSQKIGNNHTLICTCTDVTSLREAEKDRTDALRLLDAEKKLTEWLAHEVRNPLSIAMEAAQSLQEEFESDSFTPSQQTEQKEDQTYKSHNMEPDSFTPSQQTEQKEAQIYKSHNMDYHSYPDLIIQSISYVVEILSKMLDLNKVTEGKILLRPSVCSLRENIIRPIQEMMNLKGNKVPISISGEDMKIHIDTLRVKQVITNLISNALKFTNEGFINIHSYRTNKDVDGSDIPDSLVIAVSDSGVGVPSKNREQLFSRWEQLGTNVNGTGIGLCLSRFLVLAMKGQIYLNENYNSGIKDSPGAQVRLIWLSLQVFFSSTSQSH